MTFDATLDSEREVRRLNAKLKAEQQLTAELKAIIIQKEAEQARIIEDIRKEADRILETKINADQREYATKVAKFETTVSHMTELLAKVSQIKLPDATTPLVKLCKSNIQDFYQTVGTNITIRRVMDMTDENIEKSIEMLKDVEKMFFAINQLVESCFNEEEL